MFEFQGKIIHVDPLFRVADYTKMPKADLILITHEHGDHLDTSAMVADAARAFRPGILYPYHRGDTDPEKLVQLLKDEKDISRGKLLVNLVIRVSKCG